MSHAVATPKLTHLLSKIGGTWWIARQEAEGELVALVAENQRLKSEAEDMVLAAAYHEMHVLRDRAVVENQQLRDALERIEDPMVSIRQVREIARAALDETQA